MTFMTLFIYATCHFKNYDTGVPGHMGGGMTIMTRMTGYDTDDKLR